MSSRDLTKNLTERSYLNRTQVRPQSGRIVAIDPMAKTMSIDIGHVDTDGNTILLTGVPFLPGAPPAVGDNASLTYTDLTPYTPNVSGTSLGGVNSTQTVSGVTSIKADSGANITGDAQLVSSATVVLAESGQTITPSIPFWLLR